MGCTQLNGIIKDCTNNLGGVRQLWLNRIENVSSFNSVNGLVTQTNIVGSTFKQFHIPPNSTSYNVERNVDSDGVQEYNHSVSFSISKRLPSKGKELEALAEGNEDLIAIIQDFNGLWWILGSDTGLSLDSLSGGSGTSIGEGSNYTMSLSGKQRKLELGVDPNSIANVIPGVIVG